MGRESDENESGDQGTLIDVDGDGDGARGRTGVYAF